MAEFGPADMIEGEDGELLSGADYNSLEGNLPEGEGESDVFNEAVRASSDLVETSPVAEGAEEISAAEKAYDAASDKVERRVDQGLDRKAAWYEADPTGKIRKAYEDEERQKQADLNHQEIEKIRQATHDAKVAAIDATILDPEARERALTELRAAERLAEDKRHRKA